jgi:hypothetical protein
MLGRWTLRRAAGAGVVSGLAAVALWPAYAMLQEPLRLPFAAALAAAAFCGLSILWITAKDVARGRRRGGKAKALRAFDLAFALLLTVPSLTALHTLLS